MGQGLVGPDVLPLKEDLPAGGLGQAVEMLDEGGLARPGAADDAQVLAGVDVQVDAIQCPLLKGGVGAVDMGQLF